MYDFAAYGKILSKLNHMCLYDMCKENYYVYIYIFSILKQHNLICLYYTDVHTCISCSIYSKIVEGKIYIIPTW